ncbi:helix-turn-helix transcriptional regulator [Streptomyces sp. M10(2022)]
MPPQEWFGNELRNLRLEHGLSAKALGRLVQVSDDMILSIEKGNIQAAVATWLNGSMMSSVREGCSTGRGRWPSVTAMPTESALMPIGHPREEGWARPGVGRPHPGQRRTDSSPWEP